MAKVSMAYLGDPTAEDNKRQGEDGDVDNSRDNDISRNIDTT